MCGIAAIVVAERGRSVEAAVGRMVAALRHRGPDSEGIHNFGRAVLGSARLSIVDVDGGRQPMLTGNGEVGVTFNGAIYGFRELKAQLGRYPFRTTTDTEVILALHARDGDGFVSSLPGMFAFALWDQRTETLTCVRDRFGEKPLYYARGPNGEFVAASEIKSILASGLIEPVLDRVAISHYLQRLYVHPSQTIYANVHSLPPAHLLRFSRGQVRVERYWEPPAVEAGITMTDAVVRFRELFDAAVKKQLVADVPVGVLLSGGVDSSTVTAVASRLQPGLQTFSFGFQAGIDDERPYARDLAEQCGTSHAELADDGVDIADLLWRMQEIYDEPFADSSNIPTFLICQLARKRVKVVLGGDGADELLGGYLCWSRHLLERPASANPGSLLEMKAIRGVRRLARWVGGGAPEPGDGSLVHRYAHGSRVCFTPEEQQRLGLSHDTDHLVDYRRYREGAINDTLRFDSELYLPGDILVKTDRASMANGLELRTPFLDVDVASFCLSLPDRLKVDGESEKLLLRRAYEDRWTPAIRARSKQGFGGPMAEWLRHPAVQCLKRELLGDRNQTIFSLLDFSSVQPFVERDSQQTWSLLILALWLATHPCSLAAS